MEEAYTQQWSSKQADNDDDECYYYEFRVNFLFISYLFCKLLSVKTLF